MLSGGLVYAQVTDPVPLVSLDMKQVPIEDLFTELEKQTGMFFSYESSLLEELPKVSLTVKEESLSYCLKRLFSSLPVIYRVTGQYIILKRKPRQYTISGFVRDSISFESLISATVLDGVTGKGVLTNSYGFYSITLPAGLVVLRSSYVGYKTLEIRLTLDRDTLIDFPLIIQKALQEIVVRGRDPHSDVMSSRMGSVAISSTDLKQTPVLFGEPDLLRTLQHLPGVSSGTEILGNMYVRGGNSDENLFLIDGIPVYNVNHVGGLFSTFNSDVVRHVDFYKGGFPSRYGGRLSSVVDVRLKDGDMQKYHGNISIGLLSAKAHFEGPIIKDRTSFNLAFRRTWFDAFTAPAFGILNKKNKNGDKIFLGYSFYDLNGKINHIFSPRSRIYANFYMGQDRLRSTDWYHVNEQRIGQEMIWRWGNLVTSLNWTYIFSRKLFGNFNAFYSRYKSKTIEDNINFYNTVLKDKRTKRVYDYHSSGIEDFGLRFDFDYSPTPSHAVRFGADLVYHLHRPEDKSSHISVIDSINTTVFESFVNDPRVKAYEGSMYVEDDWIIAERWKMNAGLRLAGYQVEGKGYGSIQPRASLRYLINHDFSVKASYVKMNQYIHQLSNTYANLPSDIWVPVTKKIKPMYTHQISLGGYYNLMRKYDFSIEGYYKDINNLIEYQDNAQLFPDYTGWDDKVSMGSGRSYGVELMARKSESRTSGWMAYTLSWSDRIFNDRLVNEGKRFPAKYDNRHKFHATITHKFSNKIDLSASWMFASGNRVTIPVDSYLSHDDKNNYTLPAWLPEGEITGNPSLTLNGILGRNAARLGNYHRLDLSINIYRPGKKGRLGIWNISLYNVYSRMNPFYIQEVNVRPDGKVSALQQGLIPIIPSVSYTYKF